MNKVKTERYHKISLTVVPLFLIIVPEKLFKQLIDHSDQHLCGGKHLSANKNALRDLIRYNIQAETIFLSTVTTMHQYMRSSFSYEAGWIYPFLQYYGQSDSSEIHRLSGFIFISSNNNHLFFENSCKPYFSYKLSVSVRLTWRNGNR